MEFTESQKRAVNTRGRSILVSAAAGSGKTAVLTKRIIGLLTDPDDPADISDMLIVTFTRAAAAELRQRITAELTSALIARPGDPHLAAQLTAIGSARISTIDSYYLELAGEYFQRLSLPSSFRVIDPSETSALRTGILDGVIERRFASDPDFGHFADTVTSARGDGELASVIERFAVLCENRPEGAAFLSACADACQTESGLPFFESRAGKAALDWCLRTLDGFASRAEFCRRTAESDDACSSYAGDFSLLRDTARELRDRLASGDYAGARLCADSFSPARKGRARRGGTSDVSDYLRDERKAVIDGIKQLTGDFILISDADTSAAMLDTASVCRVLHSAVTEFTDLYAREKKAGRMVDFQDLRRCAVSLLIGPDGGPTDAALNERARFSHIFVDEYQDTDPVQDLIFRTISDGTNLFIVGDIKQSIYSFRGAEPSLFAARRKEWDRGADSGGCLPCSVYMSENFRCSPNVVDFANLVCSYLFRQADLCGGGIGYRPEDDLVFSRRGEVSSEPVRVVLCEAPGDGSSSPAGAEAGFIVSEIRRLLKEGRLPGGAPVRCGDIAVLARKNDVLDGIASRLAAEGIPYSNGVGERLFENPEVLLMVSVLSAVDNPQRDVHLAAAMKSPFFGFTLSDLVMIRSSGTGESLCDSVRRYAGCGADAGLALRCGEFLSRLDRLRERASSLPADRFIRCLFSESEALSYAGSSSESRRQTPSERRRNLRALYESALRYRASAYSTLHDFVVYLSDVIARGGTVTTAPTASADAVNLMTVHRSKGLEFPVVFLCGCGSKFNTDDTNKTYLYTAEYGIGPAIKRTDASGLCVYDTPMRKAAANVIRERLYQEEMRVLYVGLTRARDVLYMTAGGRQGFAASKERSAGFARMRGGSDAVLGAKSWIDWILTALDGAGSDSPGCFSVTELPAAGDTGTDPVEAGPGGERAADPVEPGPGGGAIAAPDTVPCVDRADSPEDPAAGGSFREEPQADPDTVERLVRSMTYSYPYSGLSVIPSKVSVSRLFPGYLDADGDGSAVLEKAAGMRSREPRFMSGVATAADRGTATHLFLQFCDFSRLSADPGAVLAEAERLEAERFIPPGTTKLVRVPELVRFASSRFFADIRAAVRIFRETRFNLLLPASAFALSEESRSALSGETLFVQGVIDIFFETADGRTVLCDYKTDRMPDGILADPAAVRDLMFERHGNQLGYYAASVRRLTGRYPDDVLVFPLQFGEAVRLDMIGPDSPLSLDQ